MKIFIYLLPQALFTKPLGRKPFDSVHKGRFKRRIPYSLYRCIHISIGSYLSNHRTIRIQNRYTVRVLMPNT